jgi:hypothetical protein
MSKPRSPDENLRMTPPSSDGCSAAVQIHPAFPLAMDR